MNEWYAIDSGRTIGTVGSEDGVILLDDEHAAGARITIERGGTIAPFSITCGVYGAMFHTRFFGSEDEARRECTEMKAALATLLDELTRETDVQATGTIVAQFVERFP
jgi:hypothetical protein